MAFLITIYSGIPAKKEMSRLILALSMRTFQCPLESQKPAAFAAAPIPLLTRQATAKATKAKAGSNTSQASPDTSAVMVRNGMLSVNVCSSVTRACASCACVLVWCARRKPLTTSFLKRMAAQIQTAICRACAGRVIRRRRPVND